MTWGPWPSVTLVPSLSVWATLEIKHSPKLFIPQLPRSRLQCPDSLPLLTPFTPKGKQTGERFWTDTRRLCCVTLTARKISYWETGTQERLLPEIPNATLCEGVEERLNRKLFLPRYTKMRTPKTVPWSRGRSCKDNAMPCFCQITLAQEPTTGPFS